MLDTSSFSNIKNEEKAYRSLAKKANTELIRDIEEFIRYQYELHDKLSIQVEKICPKGDMEKPPKDDLRLCVSHLLYRQNFKAIHASYDMILTGKIQTACILLRRVQESNLTQYYIGLCTKEEFSEYYKASQETHDKHTENNRNACKQKKSAKHTENNRNACKQKKSNDHVKFTHNFYKQKLFVGDNFAMVSRYYSVMSEFVHPNWQTYDFSYDNELIHNILSLIPLLSFFNVVSYCQAYSFYRNILPKMLELVQPFVDDRLHDLKDDDMKLFPNKKNLISKVLWYPNSNKN